jgi:glutathione synthase
LQATEAIQQAIDDHGRKWVLKPQREGGGNNYYNNHLRDFLMTHKDEDMIRGYVLMQRIFPSLHQTAFYKQGTVAIGASLSELGVYGIYLGDGTNTLVNNYSGYLLRTKAEGVDEGGVATGYSVLNSIFLV